MSQIKEALGDTSTGRAGTAAAEEVNRLINSQEKGVKTLDEYKKALEEDPESFDGGIEAGTDWLFNQNINMKEGTDLMGLIWRKHLLSGTRLRHQSHTS